MTEDRTRHVLARISNNPELARVVRLLQPEDLHAVITHRGLHDCSELLALATPAQLSAVFDLDLWKASQAGAEEQFDAARFCEWLEVLVDAGEATAAARLASMDVALVVAGLSPSITVLDPAVFAPLVEPTGADAVSNAGRERGVHAEIGGYIVVARRPEAWDAIVDALIALDQHHSDLFHRVMRACRKLSNSGRELDELDDLLSDAEQLRFDLSVSRDERRERLGYVAPQQARAFLDAVRQRPLTPAQLQNRHIDVTDRARALVSTAQDRRSSIDPTLFLANVLVSGCSVHGRSFTRGEAMDAVAATCNLGLEYWPQQCLRSAQRDVITTFQVGWTVLHRDVSMFAAGSLLDALDTMRFSDRDVQFDLQALARELRRHWQTGTPWRARGRLDVLAPLDLPAWAALTALFDECPVMLANVSAPDRRLHTVNPSQFQFIADADHVAAVHQFLRSVPDLLTR